MRLAQGRWLGVALAVAVPLLASCEQPGAHNDQAKAISRAEPVVAATITATEDGFSPATVTVLLGQAVELVNGDRVARTLVSPDRRIDVGVQQPGDHVTIVLDRVGVVRYEDPAKPGATGQIEVRSRP